MRHLIRWPALCAVCAIITASTWAGPMPISLSVAGYFDPGTSGAVAVNGDPLSTLTKANAVISFYGGPVNFILAPGDSLTLPIGTLWADCDDPEASVSFTGATLALAMLLDDPPAVPSIGVFDADLRGNVSITGDILNLTWNNPRDTTFYVDGCLTMDLIVEIEAKTQYVSGMPPEDVLATFTLNKPVFEPGDVTGEGVLDLLDALAALRIWGGMADSTCGEVMRGDLNDDGGLNLLDAVGIARIANGL